MHTDSSEHAAKVRTFFDRRVEAYDAFYDPPSPLLRAFNRVFRKAVALRRDRMLELARQHGCRTVLDVGCGSGRNTVWLARQGVERLVGVDISAPMIEQATELARRAGVADRCEFRHLDFIHLPRGERFDLVGAVGLFDYVLDAGPVLAHMASFAEQVVYGSFPGWTLVRSPLRKLRYALRGCPTHFYRRGEIAGLLEELKFGTIQVQPVPSGYLAWTARPAPAAS